MVNITALDVGYHGGKRWLISWLKGAQWYEECKVLGSSLLKERGTSHDRTVASSTAWRIGVLLLVHWSPHRGDQVVSSALAVTNQADEAKGTISHSSGPLAVASPLQITHLELASETRTLGRSKSSRRRWLCSVSLRSFSSDMDCLCGRAFILTERRGDRCTQRLRTSREFESWPPTIARAQVPHTHAGREQVLVAFE